MDRYRGVDGLYRQSVAYSSYGVIENYLVIRLIDCHPLTRSYITTDAPIVPSVVILLFFLPRFVRARARPLPKRRLSGVRSANKSNTPRFVQRESSSFTIHEFIMGTTEGTAGSLLLIYRYVSLATNGLRLPWCTLLARKLSLPPYSFCPIFSYSLSNFNRDGMDFTREYNLKKIASPGRFFSKYEHFPGIRKVNFILKFLLKKRYNATERTSLFPRKIIQNL